MEKYALIISIVSLAISFSHLLMSLINNMISHSKIKLIFNHDRCMVINEIIPSMNLLNPYKAIILDVRLINKSDKNIDISSVKIQHKSIPIFATKLEEDINYDFHYANTDYWEILELSKKQIIFPMHLNPHQEVDGYIIFPYVNECMINEYQDKRELIFLTSRGDVKIMCYIKSQEQVVSEYEAKL